MVPRWYNIAQRKRIAPSQTSHRNPTFLAVKCQRRLPPFPTGLMVFRMALVRPRCTLCHAVTSILLPTGWSQWSWNAGYSNSCCSAAAKLRLQNKPKVSVRQLSYSSLAVRTVIILQQRCSSSIPEGIILHQQQQYQLCTMYNSTISVHHRPAMFEHARFPPYYYCSLCLPVLKVPRTSPLWVALKSLTLPRTPRKTSFETGGTSDLRTPGNEAPTCIRYRGGGRHLSNVIDILLNRNGHYVPGSF